MNTWVIEFIMKIIYKRRHTSNFDKQTKKKTMMIPSSFRLVRSVEICISSRFLSWSDHSLGHSSADSSLVVSFARGLPASTPPVVVRLLAPPMASRVRFFAPPMAWLDPPRSLHRCWGLWYARDLSCRVCACVCVCVRARARGCASRLK